MSLSFCMLVESIATAKVQSTCQTDYLLLALLLMSVAFVYKSKLLTTMNAQIVILAVNVLVVLWRYKWAWSNHNTHLDFHKRTYPSKSIKF